ncbi:MAG: GNAT family N-acetyltransferase [Clostridia bacterium]|nr:GNAT family N-acetyltransferase [Clostridia bacterium]
MLKLATDKDLDCILSFCDGDLLGTRIGCYCLAYGFERDFLNVWVNHTASGINAVIAKFYDSITIKADCEDLSEIREFVSMLGFTTLETSESTCLKLSYKSDEIKKSYIFNGTAENMEAQELSEEYFKALYQLVCENIPGSFGDDKESYLAFLSDFTFRKRRGLARSKGIILDGKLVSSVITSAEVPGNALISAVASDKTVRGTGIGRKTVLTMLSELQSEGKNIYVIALNESAEGFYEHLGFEFKENITIIRGR